MNSRRSFERFAHHRSKLLRILAQFLNFRLGRRSGINSRLNTVRSLIHPFLSLATVEMNPFKYIILPTVL